MGRMESRTCGGCGYVAVVVVCGEWLCVCVWREGRKEGRKGTGVHTCIYRGPGPVYNVNSGSSHTISPLHTYLALSIYPYIHPYIHPFILTRTIFSPVENEVLHYPGVRRHTDGFYRPGCAFGQRGESWIDGVGEEVVLWADCVSLGGVCGEFMTFTYVSWVVG